MPFNAAAWFAAHKAAAIGGGGAAALLLVIKKKKAATGPVGASSSPAGTVAAPAGAAAYDSTAQDVYGSIEPQLAALQQQISQGQTTAAAPAAPNAFFAKYGAGAWARDAGYARSQGVTNLVAPTDLAGYGAQRYGQNLYAIGAASAGAPGSTQVPGGAFTVAQTLAESRWADANMGATV